MTQRQASLSEHVEPCPSCGSETPHEVGVELRTESEQSANRAFSREPYRVAECTRCGETRARRMNNA